MWFSDEFTLLKIQRLEDIGAVHTFEIGCTSRESIKFASETIFP